MDFQKTYLVLLLQCKKERIKQALEFLERSNQSCVFFDELKKLTYEYLQKIE